MQSRLVLTAALIAFLSLATSSMAQDHVAAVFTFGHGTGSLTTPVTRYLAGFDGASATAATGDVYKIVIPRAGTLRKLYWYADPLSTLTGTNHTVTVRIDNTDSPLTAPWNQASKSGRNTAVSVPVGAGSVISVKLVLTGGSGNITRPSVSFEYAVTDTSAGINPGDMSYWNGSVWVVLPIGTQGQGLTVCNGIPTWGSCLPAITTAPTTTAASYITGNTASSGGNITNDGGGAVTARGVCWSTTTNPTTANSKTTNGTGTGVFTSTLTGLTVNTTYHVRAYATSSTGTAYGNEVSLTVPIAVGYSYQGGIIGYLLQPGDPGYDASVPHGLIAAPSDQVTNCVGGWGCRSTLISVTDGSAIGKGNQNTMDILARCPEQGIAARFCSDLVLNGYSDWFLPSKNEWFALFANRAAIGNLGGSIYWSSTEIDSQLAWGISFLDGSGDQAAKDEEARSVRAIRAF